MGTLKKPNKVYFLKTDPNYDEVVFFNKFSELQTYLDEAVWEGEENMHEWKIWSTEESKYQLPRVTRTVEVDE